MKFRYGANCYRQNPEHLDEYNHPPKSVQKNNSFFVKKKF